MFDAAAVSAVRREKAARSDEQRPQTQGDQPRGRAVYSSEHPTHDPAQAQQRQWATSIMPGGTMGYSVALRQAIHRLHSGDAPEEGFLNLGLSNPAGQLC